MIVALLLTSALLATWLSYWIIRSMENIFNRRDPVNRTTKTVSLSCPVFLATILYLGMFFLGSSGIEDYLNASLVTPSSREFWGLILVVAALLAGLSILTAIAIGKLQKTKST
jgi:formate-dependent nitrite reductase membrane component NrfD